MQIICNSIIHYMDLLHMHDLVDCRFDNHRFNFEQNCKHACHILLLLWIATSVHETAHSDIMIVKEYECREYIQLLPLCNLTCSTSLHNLCHHSRIYNTSHDSIYKSYDSTPTASRNVLMEMSRLKINRRA